MMDLSKYKIITIANLIKKKKQKTDSYQRKVTPSHPLILNLFLCLSFCVYDHDACDVDGFFFLPGAHELQ